MERRCLEIRIGVGRPECRFGTADELPVEIISILEALAAQADNTVNNG